MTEEIKDLVDKGIIKIKPKDFTRKSTISIHEEEEDYFVIYSELPIVGGVLKTKKELLDLLIECLGYSRETVLIEQELENDNV